VSTYLYRLGRVAYRRRVWVISLWLGLLMLSGVGAATLAGETEDSFELPGTESVQAMELLNERFPQAAPSGSSARVVFAAPPGQTLADPDNQAAISATVAQLSRVPDVTTVNDPFQVGTVSADSTIAYAEVTFGLSWPADALVQLEEAAAPAEAAGLVVELGGDALQGDIPESFLQAELIGLALAALVLIVTFGSFVAAGMPLLNAIIGVGTTIALIAVASRFFDLGSSTPILATMLGLALAIDYSLFIASRYRHELAIGRDGPEAAGRALGTAGSAVVFAGLTVMVALCGLWVVGIPMLTEMGFAAAFAVVMAVLIALTMLPALFGFAGRRILGGRIPGLRSRDPESDEQTRPGVAGRWSALVTRRPLVVVLTVGLAMLVLAAPALDLRLGLPDDGSRSAADTQRRAYDLIAEGFGAGVNGPLLVVVDAAGVDAASAGAQVAEVVGGLDNVAVVVPPVVNPAGDTAIITVLPTTGPGAVETEELVTAIRDHAAGLRQATGATTVAVTGITAVIIDFNRSMSRALLPYLSLIAGLSILLLMLVFRSVLVPLKAALGFLLTIGATFGVVVAVFQWGWLSGLLAVDQTGVVISFLPIILVGIVFGLAMDYQVFMVTRMREEYVHGAEPVPAVVTGFRHGSRVVTAAAIIMISVFGAFAFSGDDFIMQIAFALAIAIALDAFVVRMTLVPALLALLQRRAWWLPRWLDRMLPQVDVEGEKLRRLPESPKPVAAGYSAVGGTGRAG
jgi:putative drug exporter of the RND superfamily